jgi:hypothetical protein
LARRVAVAAIGFSGHGWFWPGKRSRLSATRHLLVNTHVTLRPWGIPYRIRSPSFATIKISNPSVGIWLLRR